MEIEYFKKRHMSTFVIIIINIDAEGCHGFRKCENGGRNSKSYRLQASSLEAFRYELLGCKEVQEEEEEFSSGVNKL